MKEKSYRVWLRIEEIDESEGYQSKLVEQIELATFDTMEKALTCRYELSQKCSFGGTDETKLLNRMISRETFRSGD